MIFRSRCLVRNQSSGVLMITGMFYSNFSGNTTVNVSRQRSRKHIVEMRQIMSLSKIISLQTRARICSVGGGYSNCISSQSRNSVAECCGGFPSRGLSRNPFIPPATNRLLIAPEIRTNDSINRMTSFSCGCSDGNSKGLPAIVSHGWLAIIPT